MLGAKVLPRSSEDLSIKSMQDCSYFYAMNEILSGRLWRSISIVGFVEDVLVIYVCICVLVVYMCWLYMFVEDVMEYSRVCGGSPPPSSARLVAPYSEK
jgi:hypothetical protein